MLRFLLQPGSIVDFNEDDQYIAKYSSWALQTSVSWDATNECIASYSYVTPCDHRVNHVSKHCYHL
jgi:hypothetical protein